MSDRYISTPVGFARVNREPLDKYAQFDTLQDAVTYAASGASYTGEVIAVSYGGNDHNFGLYEVNRNRKLTPASLNGGLTPSAINELYIEKAGVLDWLLIYYHDTSEVYTSDVTIGNSTINPYKFSMLNHLELFRNTNKELSFMLRKNGTENRWRQKTNPLTMYLPSDGATSDGVILSVNINRLEKKDTTNAYITDYSNQDYVSICPKVASTDVIELFVDATDYFGGEYS